MNKKIFYLILCQIVLLLIGCYSGPETENGSTSSPIEWKGILETPPLKPQENWLYYDSNLKISLIFNGTHWDTMTISGIDGVSMQWLGADTTPPINPPINSAYYNSKDKVSYLFTGTTWDTLSCSGQDGLSIMWKGHLPIEPEEPKHNWIYYNTTDNITYIYNYDTWEVFTSAGIDGRSLTWLGTFNEHPNSPIINGAYYNSIRKCSYIFDGTGWFIICKDGLKGDEGTSIIWLGEKLYPPVKPLVNWAYFNMVDHNSYIYDGTEWQYLTKNGNDGTSIIWIGELNYFPDDPKLNWAFYHSAEKTSFIFNGTEWCTLIKNGKDGEEGISIKWLGSFPQHPNGAEINNIYYNYYNKTTFIYTEKGWKVFSDGGTNGSDGSDGEDGNDGKDADTATAHKSQYVWTNDTLFLNHNFSSSNVFYIAQYVNPKDSSIHYWDDPSPEWHAAFDSVSNKKIYQSNVENQYRTLFKRNDGTILHVYTETNSMYKGGLFCTINSDGDLGSPTRFSENTLTDLSVHETNDNTLIFSYLNQDQDSSFVITLMNETEEKRDLVVAQKDIQFCRTTLVNDTTILAIYVNSTGANYITTVHIDGTIATPHKLSDTYSASSFEMKTLNNSDVMLLGINNGKLLSINIHGDGTTTQKEYETTSKCEQIYPFVQAPDGSVIAALKLEDNSTFYTSRLALLKIGQNGSFIKYDSVVINPESVNITLLDDGNISMLLNSYIPYRLLCLQFLLDQDMKVLSENELNPLNVLPSVIESKKDELLYTHTVTSDRKEVHLEVLRKTPHAPELVLKALSSDKACLINYTGRCLLLTLTAYKNNDEYLRALQSR